MAEVSPTEARSTSVAEQQVPDSPSSLLAPVPSQPALSASSRVLAQRSLAAWCLGLACAGPLGSWSALLQPFAQALINIFTSLVVPYVLLASVLGFAQWGRAGENRLLRAGATSLALLWGLAIATLYAAASCIPGHGSAAFASRSQATLPSSTDLLRLLVAPNIFEALSAGAVPAVVLFFGLWAWYLGKTPGHEPILELLAPLKKSLEVAGNALNLALPLLIFLRTTTSAGLFSDIHQGEARLYVLSVLVAGLLLTLVLLPGAVALLTPLRFWPTLQSTSLAALSALAAGSMFAVLMQVATSLRDLVNQAMVGETEEAAGRAREDATTLLSLLAGIPGAGALLVLPYVFFAAYQADHRLSLWDHCNLVLQSWPSVLLGPTFALRHLSAAVGVRNPSMEAFAAVDPICDRVRQMVGASYLIVAVILAQQGARGRLRGSVGRFLALAGGVLLPVTLLGRVVAADALLGPSIQEAYAEQRATLPSTVPVRRLAQVRPRTPMQRSLRAVRCGRPLRVALTEDQPPFAYRNAHRELVGASVDLAASLAADLKGHLEVVLVPRERLHQALADGRVDLALAPVIASSERLLEHALSAPLCKVRPAFVCSHERSDEVMRHLTERDGRGLRVGVRGALAEYVQGYLPGASHVAVTSLDTLLRPGALDLVLCADLEGTAWEVSHPSYETEPIPGAAPEVYCFLMAREDQDLQAFVRSWMEVLALQGELDLLLEKWVYGGLGSPSAHPGRQAVQAR